MILNEAIRAALEGHFVSNNSFDNTQSMHSFNGDLYYEDGANLSATGFVNRELRAYDWAKDGWFIKYPKERVNIEKLKEMHKTKYTLQGSSYEDCIMNNEY